MTWHENGMETAENYEPSPNKTSSRSKTLISTTHTNSSSRRQKYETWKRSDFTMITNQIELSAEVDLKRSNFDDELSLNVL